jgi:hypothetical protein
VVERSTVEKWLPSAAVDGGEATPLTPCDRVHTPEAFAGFGALSVVTVDLDDDLVDRFTGDRRTSAVSVLAAGETVYGSADSIYVSTTRWTDPDVGDDATGTSARSFPAPSSPATTELHRFAINDDGPATYAASGSVRGRLLDQFSMSEHDGHLRVATTEDGTWGPDAEDSESFVTTFAERDGALEQVGQVGGLGRGERIYAVRFLGDVGYVVTFREVDPLYTVDLADPANPRVTGELKIEGYSAYLHPIGDDLLIGVGQDATLEGRTTGTQISLFDVSDPAAPERLHHHAIADGSSEAEYDHHAFLWWASAGLAVLPVESWSFDEATGAESHRSGAVGLTVDRATGIVEQGWISHPAAGGDHWAAQVRRSIVVGDTLLTLSERGVHAADLATFSERAWIPFA